jgi:hypothetical protein
MKLPQKIEIESYDPRSSAASFYESASMSDLHYHGFKEVNYFQQNKRQAGTFVPS